jgi:hypothetical protein
VGRKLVLLALGAATAAYVISAQRRRAVRVENPIGNGGSAGKSEMVKRLVGEARERLRR